MMLSQLSDVELIENFQDLVVDEREKLVFQLEHISELDRRKLFFHYSSLRAYLVEEYGFEEWSAERKIRAARLFNRFPDLKLKMESGKLNFTLLELAQGCAHREKLSDSELWEILEAISGMSCRSAKREIASRYPASLDLPIDRVIPLTSEFSEVRFVASQELLSKLEEIRGLLAHSHPQLKMGELIDILATEYRERHHPEEKARRAEERETKKKEKKEEKEEGKGDKNQSEIVESPTVPRLKNQFEKRTPSQAIVYKLTRTEGYCCSYVDPVTQRKCLSKRGLEIDHIQAWSDGGETALANLRYLCKNHHARVSFLKFGESSKYFKI
jgi:hypothetical protein